MTILLNKMTKDEFREYLDHLIKKYAVQNIENGDWDEDEALNLSKLQLTALLPNGLETEDHFLFSLFNNKLNMNIGYLWLNIQETKQKKKGFIYDIELFDMFRGKGLGKESLEVLEDYLRSINVKSVGLHVFAKNTLARNLYLKYGFKDVSYNMSKELL